MAQPMIDTLAVANTLQQSGMEREQAEAFARSLGSELGEHVAGHKDLELGFAGIRAHVDQRFAQVDQRFVDFGAHVDERFAQVDKQFAQVDKQFAHVDKQFVELKTEIKGEIKALGSKFNMLGVVLASALAFLGVIVGLDRLV